MQDRQIIAVENTDGIWNGLLPDFSQGTVINDYHITLQVGGHAIDIDISSSPGGNIEGGYETTSIKALVNAVTDFHFVLYPEDFLNRIGKLFGLQDEILGYPEFDHRVIVKTDNVARLKRLLAPPEKREAFQHLSGFSFKLGNNNDDEDRYLDLSIQRAIIDLNELKKLLSVFYNVLIALEKS
jgi:hypothetical protein